jgi:ATP phosphoribosyltransferase
MEFRQIRISLPSKGRLAEDSLQFLSECGLTVHKPNPRQYEARIPAIPELTVLFQRPGDIVVSVRDGSVDFGITGMDVIAERRGKTDEILVLHDALGFGHCTLSLAVPESWEKVTNMAELVVYSQQLGRRLRVATKYPYLTEKFLCAFDLEHELISAEGTLETAPAIGYADLISDLVSSGQTLRDNRLRALSDGVVQASQAALIANRQSLLDSPQVHAMARQLLEYFEAYLRASDRLAIFANIRGSSPELIADRLASQETIGGLQGPTISRVYPASGDTNWFAVHIVVRRDRLFQAVTELRSIGGSGVVVAPVTYIFEEEPPRYKAMLEALERT